MEMIDIIINLYMVRLRVPYVPVTKNEKKNMEMIDINIY